MFGQVEEISGLSTYDFICLVAHYNSISGKDDGDVSEDAKKRGYTAEQLEHAKKRKAEKFSPVESCGLRFTKPFDQLKFGSLSYVLTLFESFERGSMPYPGSVSEQPAQILEIFSTLRQLKVEAHNREITKHNGRNKHKNQPRTRR